MLSEPWSYCIEPGMTVQTTGKGLRFGTSADVEQGASLLCHQAAKALRRISRPFVAPSKIWCFCGFRLVP